MYTDPLYFLEQIRARNLTGWIRAMQHFVTEWFKLQLRGCIQKFPD